MDKRQRWTMVAVVLGSGIVFLDSTVVNVALPRIGQELSSSFFRILEAQSFVYSGYLLSLSALLILAGALSDYYGRCKLFKIGLVGFGLTSLLCGMAPNMEALIAFRILQGAAGAILVPGSLSIINSTFSGEERGRAFGIWAGGSAFTTILGPFLGGLLVQTVSWRAAFLINVPLVFLAYYATRKYVQESRDEQAGAHFDWAGAVTVALAVGGVVFGLIRGQEYRWQDTAAFVSLAIGIAATIAFPILMAKSTHPLVPLDLFKSRNFTVTNLSTLIIYGALYVSFYTMGIFALGTLDYDEAAFGLATIPDTLFLAFLSARVGRWASRYGPRVFMAVGPAIMALGLLWLSRIPADSEPWKLADGLLPPTSYFTDFFPGFIIFGIGLTILVAPLTTALMTSVPERNSGVASAINNAISRIGPQLAQALIFIAVTASFYGTLSQARPNIDTSASEFREIVSPLNQPSEKVLRDAPPEVARSVEGARRNITEASTGSFHLAMQICAGMLALGAVVNAIGIRNPGPKDKDSPGPDEDEPAAAAAAA